MTDSVVFSVITGVVASVCTALPLLYGQYLRHQEEMRKLDNKEKDNELARQTARAELMAKVDDVQQVAHEARAQAVVLQDRQVEFFDAMKTNTFELRALVDGIRNSGLGKLEEGGK